MHWDRSYGRSYIVVLSYTFALFLYIKFHMQSCFCHWGEVKSDENLNVSSCCFGFLICTDVPQGLLGWAVCSLCRLFLSCLGEINMTKERKIEMQEEVWERGRDVSETGGSGRNAELGRGELQLCRACVCVCPGLECWDLPQEWAVLQPLSLCGKGGAAMLLYVPDLQSS